MPLITFGRFVLIFALLTLSLLCFPGGRIALVSPLKEVKVAR